MIFIADAGMGTAPQSLTPLSPSVEQLDLGIAPGLPTVADILEMLWPSGNFEAAVVTREMRMTNPGGRERIETIVGEEMVIEVDYEPELYRLRGRATLFVRTGDFSIHGNVILVAGYTAGRVELSRLLGE
jgi:D-ribose pyranase